MDLNNFWDYVDVRGKDDCWLWKRSKNKGGYGHLWVGRKCMDAHVVSYTLSGHDIPDGMQLDHKCRNRLCVNPNHLEPVTQKENLLRGNGWAGVHSRVTHCPNGHPYDESNTYLYRGKYRMCRACNRDRSRNNRNKENTYG